MCRLARLSNALREFRRAREAISANDVVKVANRGAHVAANQMHEQSQQGVSGLKTIAITAPFVGLFGTAVKLLDWFGPVEGPRYSNVLGIFRITAESLASTAAGLLVGILAVGWFNWRVTAGKCSTRRCKWHRWTWRSIWDQVARQRVLPAPNGRNCEPEIFRLLLALQIVIKTKHFIPLRITTFRKSQTRLFRRVVDRFPITATRRRA